MFFSRFYSFLEYPHIFPNRVIARLEYEVKVWNSTRRVNTSHSSHKTSHNQSLSKAPPPETQFLDFHFLPDTRSLSITSPKHYQTTFKTSTSSPSQISLIRDQKASQFPQFSAGKSLVPHTQYAIKAQVFMFRPSLWKISNHFCL